MAQPPSGSEQRAQEGVVVSSRPQPDFRLRLIIVWLIILPLTAFWYTLARASEPMGLTVLPEMPRRGEPIIATAKVQGTATGDEAVHYRFYVDGQPLAEGSATLAPDSVKIFQYLRLPPIDIGERVSFVLTGTSQAGSHQRAVSLPAYPPQVWSSFVSFATFSTSVMRSLVSLSYYTDSFDNKTTPNIGLVMALVLVSLLVFVSLNAPLLRIRQLTTDDQRGRIPGQPMDRLARLMERFERLSLILFIIFLGIMFTTAALIVAGVPPPP